MDWRVLGVEIASRDLYSWGQINSANTEHTTLFTETNYEDLTRRAIADQMHKSLDRIQPNAVAINGWAVPEALAAMNWCKNHRCPMVIMSESHEPSALWKEWIKQRRVRRCDAALVGGTWHASYLSKLGFPQDRIFLGYDAVDNEYFATGAAEARRNRIRIQEQLGLPDKYFFANTRFIPRKNIDGLLRSFAAYRRRVEQPWGLVISGSGEMERDWRSLALQLGLTKCIHWPGFIQYDQLPKYYALASAFVHVAHREAWGLVVNEAAACGLPLIVGERVGATCELVRDDHNGFLVDSCNQNSLIAALTRMTLMGETERRRMGERSEELASDYGPDRFGQGLRKALGAAQCTPS